MFDGDLFLALSKHCGREVRPAVGVANAGTRLALPTRYLAGYSRARKNARIGFGTSDDLVYKIIKE